MNVNSIHSFKIVLWVSFVSYIFLDGDGIIQLIWGKGDFKRGGKVIVMLRESEDSRLIQTNRK